MQDDIPPAFYPGQSIPTILTFVLERHSSLPHDMEPQLTMSLIGTLHMPGATSRTIICVSVSLAEGLTLWARDAKQAYALKPSSDPSIRPELGLPGGTYSLPLTVQVPSTPRLPPTYAVEGSGFSVTYALTVSLTAKHPYKDGVRISLAEDARAFEMMPETMPTRAPKYYPQTFFVRGGVMGTAKAMVRSDNDRWTIKPFLPTTAYSPTSLIPLSLRIEPPTHGATIQPFHILVRLALVRREHHSNRPHDFRDPLGHAGLKSEEELHAASLWLESDGISPLELNDLVLPITLADTRWTKGYSTMLNVGPPSTSTATDADHIAVSSTFHLGVTLAFIPLGTHVSSHSSTVTRFIPGGPRAQRSLCPVAPVTPLTSLASLKRHFPGTMRTLPLPIVIGSVSEPRLAMHQHRWSDLQLDRTSGREVGRMISGEGVSCEDGWILAPPRYEDAVLQVPYVFGESG